MMRFGAYGLFWFLTLIFPMRFEASANRETRDSVFLAVEDDHEPGDYDFIIPSEAQTGTIPFSRAGNLIIIQVQIDSVKGNFILDTGAPGLILNLTYFRHYKALERAEAEGGGITGEVAGGSPTMVKQMSFGNFTYTSLQADRVNLGHIENSRNLKIMGLLGAGLFRRFEIMIDYANEVIHFHRVAKNERMKYRSQYFSQRADFHTIPISTTGGKIITMVVFGKHKLNFVLDTGAETNILDSRLSKAVLADVVLERKISLIGTGSKKEEAWYGRIKEANLGLYKLENMEVLITSLKHLSAAFGKNIDGMLGYGFLSKQKIGINFLTNELYIWKQ
jgi:predicted aspartyl protease